jgi:pyruvate formate lyase activating enzyme
MKGMIFDIQHFCTHDGPGIRTVVFFKGCPLRCVWCCNPESQKATPELMFDGEKCIRCFKCICPKGALKHTDEVLLDRDICNVCGECQELCPTNALRVVGRLLSVDEVMKEVLEERVFYSENGGVTFSGGEPFMQSEFLLELSKLSKLEKLSVVVETSGYAKWEKIEKTLQYVDLIFFDIKSCDSERHFVLTGVRNELILENLKKIATECETVVRVPVVEGYNFKDESDVFKLAEICRNADVEKIDLLRYHRLGEKKYRMLGRKYDLEVGDTGFIHYMKKILEEEGFKVTIGGTNY